MTEHDRETWQQNDYDPKFIETEGYPKHKIARAFEEAGAEQIMAEHNALGELLEAAKYMQRELWNLSLSPLRENVAIDDERSLEVLDAVEKAYIVFSEAIDKAEPQTPKERR